MVNITSSAFTFQWPFPGIHFRKSWPGRQRQRFKCLETKSNPWPPDRHERVLAIELWQVPVNNRLSLSREEDDCAKCVLRLGSATICSHWKAHFPQFRVDLYHVWYFLCANYTEKSILLRSKLVNLHLTDFNGFITTPTRPVLVSTDYCYIS